MLYDGEGKIEFWGAAVAVSQRPGLMVVDVDADKGGFFLKITETNPSNYVRNIRVIMPGFDESYKDDPFHPAFLERWRGMACLRFMDWMKTNGSGIEKWSERPKPDDATFTSRGVPLEAMIDLCNRLKADAWFCMPHRADDDYVRNFSLMVRDKLDPDLKVYVEYSNEVWNSMFPQTRYSWERGAKLGIGPKERPWEGGGKYYAQRSVEIFRIWEDVFGGRERLVRVLAWQAANTWWMENIVLTYQDAYKQADALGVAPYLGMSVPLKGEGLVAGEVAGWTVDRALDHLDRHSLPEATEAIRACKSVADRFGLTLIAYEGGQHMVGVGGAEDNQAMTDLFHRANSHPRMGAIYRKYFDAWRSAGGDLFCHFSSVGNWSKWGSWGVTRYYDDDPRETPKLMAIMDWAKSCGQNVAAPSAE